MRGMLWDSRWVGAHGIARFAREVRSHLNSAEIQDVPGWGRPGSMYDFPVLTALQWRHRDRVFISPGFSCARLGPHPQLLTLHDLIHLGAAGKRAQLQRQYYSKIILPEIKRAGHVITVSEVSRGAICDWSGMAPDQVFVARPGVIPPVVARSASPERRSQEYILLVSNTKDHKNNALMFRALARLPDSVRLVTVGLPENYVSALAGLCGVRNDRVSYLSNVTDASLDDLYLKAGCLALPSRQEGFGLPSLEAMARGVPTAYCCESVSEIVGPLGFRANSFDDPEEYALLLLDAIAQRGELSSSLISRSGSFTWSQTARSFEGAMRSFISERAEQKGQSI
jgi:glycosyltransferase involved in cell wall biosynthesis